MISLLGQKPIRGCQEKHICNSKKDVIYAVKNTYTIIRSSLSQCNLGFIHGYQRNYDKYTNAGYLLRIWYQRKMNIL